MEGKQEDDAMFRQFFVQGRWDYFKIPFSRLKKLQKGKKKKRSVDFFKPLQFETIIIFIIKGKSQNQS